MHFTEWKYKDVRDGVRLRALHANPPFDVIVGQLEREMSIVCCHTTNCHDKPGYKRAIYCVEVAPQLFDILFNSQTGYRGAYFESPENGLAANRVMLSTVAPKLVAWTRANCADQDAEFAAKSLAKESAKLWLAEEVLSLCDRCKGEWDPSMSANIEIINGRWECDSNIQAKWGRQAYWFKKVRFIGAFLNDAGDEYIASHKKCRASDIWARGWS